MSNPNVSSSAEANEQYRTAMDLKSKGQTDTALTWFRRAVITDPAFVGAHIEIGRICKEKSKFDSMFLRYAFDAFRSAARQDFTLQEAHDQYVMMAHQMGVLDQLRDEYEMWLKENDKNEVLQRTYKNIVAISLAIFSPQAQIQKARASSGVKKFIFLLSFFSLVAGLGLLVLPPFFAKSAASTPGSTMTIKKENLRSLVGTGFVFLVIGAGGLLFHRRLD